MDVQEFFCILSWVIVILLFLFFIILAIRSNLLRDSIDNPASFMMQSKLLSKFSGKTFDQIPRPYSLSRTQLGIWTVIIASTYIHLILCIKDCSLDLKHSATALSLLGISVGTTGFAALIDSAPQDTSSTVPKHQNSPSRGFLIDILSDANGISITRFQNFVWTIIAICIYLFKVTSVRACELPELDGTLISLTGISSAAYLTMKIKENN